jgi:hypothetical protein
MFLFRQSRDFDRVCNLPECLAIGGCLINAHYEIAIRLHICASNTNHFGSVPIVPSHVSTN